MDLISRFTFFCILFSIIFCTFYVTKMSMPLTYGIRKCNGLELRILRFPNANQTRCAFGAIIFYYIFHRICSYYCCKVESNEMTSWNYMK